MIALDYQNLVRELCDTAGIADWQQIASAQQIDIDGVVTWLLHDEMHAPDTLSVFFDLGVMHDTAVLKYLLAHNASSPTQADICGRFGLQVEDSSVVYRVDLSWTSSLTGAELAQRLSDQLEFARNAMRECCGVFLRSGASDADRARGGGRPGSGGMFEGLLHGTA